MAYATGTAATVDDILEAIENFAIAEGWTIAKRATNLLFLEKGICKVVMGRHVYTYTDFATGSGVSKTDHTIGASLCTSINTALSNYTSHPGSLVTSETDSDSVHCNHLFDGVAEYHLFSGGVGDPDYIHCVFRVNATDWRHFSFGLLDQGDLTHGGVAFLSGNAGYFYSHTSSVTNMFHNDLTRMPWPFVNRGTTIRGTKGNLYAPDALPASPTSWAAMSSDNSSDIVLPNQTPNTSWPNGGDGAQEGFCGPVQGSPQSSWGGNVVLWTPPCMFTNTSIGRVCYLGDYPNVRLLNMEGMQPGSEITLGSDTWFVCPVGRQRAWGTQTEIGNNYSTGHYALAYKKIV